MALEYPLAAPTVKGLSGLRIKAMSMVGFQESPFTFEQTLYVHQGERWSLEAQLPPMKRAAAEQWVSMLLGLNGMEGTFLLGDPVGVTARGSWAGQSPQVDGAHASGVKTVQVKNLAAGITWKAGDWLQLGSGSSAHLHKVVQDGEAMGSPVAGSLEIWPRTRAALANSDAITIASPKGLWRLASNQRDWSIETAQIYGISFSAIEAL